MFPPPSVQAILAGKPARIAQGTLSWGAVSQAHRQLTAIGSQAASSSHRGDGRFTEGFEDAPLYTTGVKERKDKKSKGKKDRRSKGK